MLLQVENQKQSLWCWAAVATSVDHFFDHSSNSTQCKVASTVLGADCCTSQEPCNKAQRLQDALRVVGRLKRAIGETLTFEQIKAEIDDGRPVCARVAWRDGGGHFVIIADARVSAAGVQLLQIEDPLFADATIKYETFRSAYQSGQGEWVGTFLVES
jgi:hypothetical protein